MIKKTFVTMMALIPFIATAIAQPIDYVGEIADIPAPQNYFYGDISDYTEYVSSYDNVKYKNGTILKKEKIILQDNTWFTVGYCTSYVAYKRSDLFKWQGNNMISGDAKDWLENAKKSWLEIGKKPKKWAIAVFSPGKWAWLLWHVALVEHVRDDGLIIVSDMNFAGKHIVTTRVISAQLALWYIY